MLPPTRSQLPAVLLKATLLRRSSRVVSPVSVPTRSMESFARNAALEGILVVDPKPSFLLADKVFRKIATPEEEIWLSRALQAIIARRAKTLTADKAVQVQLALALIHVLFHATGSNSKRSVLALVQHLAQVEPILTHDIVTSGIVSFLQHPQLATTATASSATKPNGAASTASTSSAAAAAADAEDAKPSAETRARDLRRLLSAASTFSDELDPEARKKALVDTLVLAHHTDLLDRGTSCFMDLTFKAKILPIDLITSKQQDLISAVRTAIDDASMREAGFAALTTLVRLAPDSVMAELVSQIEADAPFDDLRALTQDELGMWSTEPGSLYVDVLSSTKAETVDKNNKNAKIDQWEAELRADIAKKKAAQNKTLTKEQKAAVDAQAKVEAQARAKVEEIRSRYVRSLRTVSSIVGARTDEIQGYMQTLVHFVLQTFEVSQARFLFENEAKESFWALSSCCSIRLEAYSMFVGVALLRTIDEQLVKEDFRAEPINELVLRILYRLRSLSEQAPLDAGTVAFIDRSLFRIVRAGGFGVDADETPIPCSSRSSCRSTLSTSMVPPVRTCATLARLSSTVSSPSSPSTRRSPRTPSRPCVTSERRSGRRRCPSKSRSCSPTSWSTKSTSAMAVFRRSSRSISPTSNSLWSSGSLATTRTRRMLDLPKRHGRRTVSMCPKPLLIRSSPCWSTRMPMFATAVLARWLLPPNSIRSKSRPSSPSSASCTRRGTRCSPPSTTVSVWSSSRQEPSGPLADACGRCCRASRPSSSPPRLRRSHFL